ncbi:Osmotin thaumatin-like protein [Lactarius quietus]|nr:Osmotin thaumatin-like protein [Lactarius quietus]
MGRTFSIANNCTYNTIWPQAILFTDSDTAPNHPSGWVAPPSSNVSFTFTVPDDWMGRIWGRPDCDFTTNPGPDSCLDGGYPGGLLCTGSGQSPVTSGQFTLSTDTGVPDFYDISLINGFNLPMRIKNNAECDDPECSVDLGANCPTQLQEPYDPTGFPSECNSACAAGLTPDPNNDPNCCTGKYHSIQACPPSSVQYYSYFKSNCPDTYVYIYDSDSPPLHTCPSASEADYAITLCSQKD